MSEIELVEALPSPAFNPGFLAVDVWPTYMGIATGHPGEGPVPDHEPFEHLDYHRGQIHWSTQNGQVVGCSRVCAPAGVYTHLVFCYGPIREMMAGFDQLEHPIVFDRSGHVDINPIQNQDYLPRQSP